jgi:hypothetical protein
MTCIVKDPAKAGMDISGVVSFLGGEKKNHRR